MKVAIPLAEGKLTAHFGHCQDFALVDVAERQIKGTTIVEPPPHEPGVLPKWLHDQGVTVVIAGGMGNRAMQLFDQAGITVVTGAPSETPTFLVQAYLDNKLVTGDNACDH